MNNVEEIKKEIEESIKEVCGKNKPYQNIVSNSDSYNKYWIIRSYNTKEEAIANYENDIKFFQEKASKVLSRQMYLSMYPFSYASICDKDLLTE